MAPKNVRSESGRSDGAARCVRIGVISDTHGYLDPVVLELFEGVDAIILAGDILDPAIVEALARVAPVTAVNGNVDPPELAGSLPQDASGEAGGVTFVVSHKRKRLMKRLAAGKFRLARTTRCPIWSSSGTSTSPRHRGWTGRCS